MPFSVDDFKSGLTRGGARPNLFEVQMEFPALAAGQSAQIKQVFIKRAGAADDHQTAAPGHVINGNQPP